MIKNKAKQLLQPTDFLELIPKKTWIEYHPFLVVLIVLLSSILLSLVLISI